MKLPRIKHLYKNNEVEKLESTVVVLESFTEHRSIQDHEMDVVGDLITDLCGAVEMHKMVAQGVPEKDAANGFVKKVLGSIDK